MNLKEVEDQAPKFGMSPGLEARFATAPLELQESGVSYQRFEPNFRLPFGHKHKSQEELYVIVNGSARVKIDDEVVELGPMGRGESRERSDARVRGRAGRRRAARFRRAEHRRLAGGGRRDDAGLVEGVPVSYPRVFAASLDHTLKSM